MIKEITVKTALHYHDTKFASNYDLNIYRGCEHRCKYCFAQYSHKYLESDFFNDIYVKINVAEILDKELTKKTWKHDLINISGVCDCYQPIEKKYKIMPKVLEVLIKHKNPVFILTKSDLIARDYELIKELSDMTQVCISTTITTLDEDIRKKLEPNTCSSIDRLKMLSKFVGLNCKTNVMLMPIIPYLTDSRRNLEGIYRLCYETGIEHIIPAPLHLRGSLKRYFYSFLQKEFPDTFDKIVKLYDTAYVKKEYSKKLNKFLFNLKKKYGIYNLKNDLKVDNITDKINIFPKDNGGQLDLFGMTPK